MDQKMIVRVCLVYDFKLKKSAAESHHSLVSAFGNDVVFKRQCERWFQRFAAGDESLEDEKLGRHAPVLDSDLSRTAVEADPTRSTQELVVEFVYSKSYSKSCFQFDRSVENRETWLDRFAPFAVQL
ncbi:unnamed protein product [Heligmosomoides polygyrus]|uniref:HTH_48 domain-containing protein n=1 Tax=Heligmosomoides polygyrus TaxID=6339 RepID=A0A183FR52_HELPZ|nr:unnamed protein product [Heligmosomoides polygyrus]